MIKIIISKSSGYVISRMIENSEGRGNRYNIKLNKSVVLSIRKNVHYRASQPAMMIHNKHLVYFFNLHSTSNGVRLITSLCKHD